MNAHRCISVQVLTLAFFAANLLFTGRAAAQSSVPSDLRNTVALQIALERSGFSPGLIDGTHGGKTKRALAEFQKARKLAATGELDAKTRVALNIDEGEALTRYTITALDESAIGAVPTDWNQRAKLKRMSFSSLSELVCERFHCHSRLLGQLNPAKRLNALKIGDTLTVPNAGDTQPATATRLAVNLGEKMIYAYNSSGQMVGLFHCSIPAKKEKLPSGQAKVESVVENPVYTFNPDMWPEVKNVKEILTIPAGPRNPVGVRWIGLSLPGVGIHGTPNPEMIGKTGSHGCIRLTNWDAARLARMISVGTPVKFIPVGDRLADSGSR